MNLLEQYLENYESLQEMKGDLLESPTLSLETVDYIFEGRDLTKYNWEGLNDTGKMRELQSIEDKLAKIKGRESIMIEAHEPSFLEKFRTWATGSRIMGYFDPNTHKIYINADLLKSSENIKELVETVAHEGIHAYQQDCVNGKITHYNPDEVEIWRENILNYKPAQIYGYEIYRHQPIEEMAFSRGSTIANSYQYA